MDMVASRMQHPPKFPSKSNEPTVNGGLEEELFYEYRHDRKSVDAGWGMVFDGQPSNGGTAVALEPPLENGGARAPLSSKDVRPTPQPIPIGEKDQLVALRGPALKIAENMEASLSIPVATSQRVMPVKVIDENRRLVNQYRESSSKSKISYTHLVAWAIVRAIEKVPAINQAYAERGADSF